MCQLVAFSRNSNETFVASLTCLCMFIYHFRKPWFVSLAVNLKAMLDFTILDQHVDLCPDHKLTRVV